MVNSLKFKGRWRDYQKRILDNLDFHLRDRKLHVVAAPGAGKTTLGIEVISRIDRPTLILAPTNTIKNQWKDRICTAFLDEKDYDIVSTNIKEPKYITVITYQALLAAFCGENDDSEDSHTYEDDKDNDTSNEDSDSIKSSKRFKEQKADEIIKILKDAKISLLCFDEAHHLRKEWWKALMYLNENLEPEQTLALTATPPYDADINEWNRYQELCGEIDEVISIPELVANGDLCPHQDFIYFSKLKENEKELLRKYNNAVKQLLEKLFGDYEFINYLSNMKFLTETKAYTEEILDNPDFYVSVVSLIHKLNMPVSKDFLKLFKAREFEIPQFTTKQAANFFTGFFDQKSTLFNDIEPKKEEYFNLAKHLGLIHNNKIVLNGSIKIQKQIASSIGKLDSICEIVGIESETLGTELRMVILTDLIRANDTDNSHLGVIPIWRVLKSKYRSDKISLGVLCGSLILIPKEKEGDLQELLLKNDIPKDSLSVTSYPEDENFVKITPKESTKNAIVQLITEMFNKGHLTVLVGTQALLGEGWDAPCINSLILSSTVSSYMLSNQMRGRAIRIDKHNPEKISNIWHLASIGLPNYEKTLTEEIFGKTETDADYDANSALFYDLNQLKKRFEGFEAPGYYDKHEISNGLERVLKSSKIWGIIQKRKEKAFDDLNITTVNFAKNREQTKQWWNEALNLGYNNTSMSLKTGVEARETSVKTLTYKGYKQILETICGYFAAILYSIFYAREMLLAFLAVATAIFLVIIVWLGLKYLKTGSCGGIMKQIAIVMLETLSYQGHIKCSLKRVGLNVKQDPEGIYVSCVNLPTEDNNLFIKCLQEFLNPVENPRYLFVKHDKFLNTIKQTDYFSIPAILSSNKRDVELFKTLWEKYIGKCEIVYTRNLEGRKLLLLARKESFSALKREKTKRISKWG